MVLLLTLGGSRVSGILFFLFPPHSLARNLIPKNNQEEEEEEEPKNFLFCFMHAVHHHPKEKISQKKTLLSKCKSFGCCMTNLIFPQTDRGVHVTFSQFFVPNQARSIEGGGGGRRRCQTVPCCMSKATSILLLLFVFFFFFFQPSLPELTHQPYL